MHCAQRCLPVRRAQGWFASRLAAPAKVKAQSTFKWKITSADVKGSRFDVDDPGSATDLVRRIEAMLGGV
jgi:hypothetical protein